jgi:hypothetical protein
MNRFPFVAVLAAIFICGFSTQAAFAAMSNVAPNSREGKEVLIAGGATNKDLHLNWYRSFEHFEAQHPTVAHDFQRNPRLVVSSRFRHENPQWGSYLKTHPDLARNIAANPGNYVVIEPQFATSFAQYRHMT